MNANSKDSVTIAIPTYDRKDYLVECLESIRLQTFKNIEVKIFDNCSNYDIQVVRDMFSDIKIEIITSTNNIGNLANFERIIKYKFTTEYVMIFHDDDTIHPHYIQESIKFLSLNKVAWVGSNIEFVEKQNAHNMLTFDSKLNINFTKFNKFDLIKSILNGLNIGFNTVVYRTGDVNKLRLRHLEFGKWADRPMILDILSEDSLVAVTHSKCIKYRLHEGQDSQVKPLDNNYIINLFKYYSEEFEKNGSESFNNYSTDLAIVNCVTNSRNVSELVKNIREFRNYGYFSFTKIGLKGLYYLLRFFIK